MDGASLWHFEQHLETFFIVPTCALHPSYGDSLVNAAFPISKLVAHSVKCVRSALKAMVRMASNGHREPLGVTDHYTVQFWHVRGRKQTEILTTDILTKGHNAA